MNNQNDNYVPQTDERVVYVKEKQNNLPWIIGCFSILLIFLCACVAPLLFIATLGNINVGDESLNEISKKTIYEANTTKANSVKVAVIDISGAIYYSVPGSGEPEEGASSANIIAQLDKAYNDEDTKAVLLRFNSPGGEVSAAEPICNKIISVSAKKPVYSFIDTMGASLGYLLPNCTKYIYSRPEAVTGSIGVIIQAVDYYGVLERLGGKVIFITNSSGSQKSGQDVFKEGSPTYKTYQSLLDETYNYFVDKVYTGRRLNHPEITKDDIRKYADGRILSGNQAKNIKFVDELGTFEQTAEAISIRETSLNGNKVIFEQYIVEVNPFADLFSSAKAAISATNIKEQIRTSQTKVLMQEGIISPRE